MKSGWCPLPQAEAYAYPRRYHVPIPVPIPVPILLPIPLRIPPVVQSLIRAGPGTTVDSRQTRDRFDAGFPKYGESLWSTRAT